MNKRATDDVINGTQSRTNFIIIGYREVIAKSGEQMVVRRYSLSECSVITDIFYASLFKIGFSLRFDASLANDKQRFRF